MAETVKSTATIKTLAISSYVPGQIYALGREAHPRPFSIN